MQSEAIKGQRKLLINQKSENIFSKSNIILYIITLAASVAIGFGIYHYFLAPQNQAKVTTSIVAVSRGSIENTVTASGSITPARQAKLAFGVAGTIAEVNVKVGDEVKKDQVLATLITSTLETKVQQAMNVR